MDLIHIDFSNCYIDPNERSEKNNAMADIPSQTFKDIKFAEAQKIKRPTLNIIYLSPRIIHGKITGYLQR